MLKLLSVLMAGVLALAACSSSADMTAAEGAVAKFHGQLDQGLFAEIYQESADDLKKVSKQEDFVALLDAVHRKLGDTKSSSKQGWNINYHTSGTFVTLTYKTVYAEGEAAEQFVYRLNGQAAVLAGYHVNSNALIIK